MATKARMLVTLSFASAALAAIVPGVFDPARAAPDSSLALIALETAPAADAVVPLPAAPRLLASSTAGQGSGVAQKARATVPPGCERIVSPLVRSAASSTVSRCIT